MTGNEVLKLAYDIMGEEESGNSEFTAFVPGILTVLLAETFAVNNNLRQSKDLPVLNEMPMITEDSMEEELAYEPEIQRTVLPYGICEKFAYYDDDMSKTGYYNSLYVNGVNACLRGIPQEHGVEDLY